MALKFAKEAGPNCRLTLWLITHNNSGTEIADDKQPTVQQVYNGLPLWDPTAGNLSLLSMLRDRVNAAAAMNDDDIVDPNNPKGTPFIKLKKAKRVLNLIDTFLDDPNSETSYPLKMSDLFEGSVLSVDRALRTLLLELKRIGVYWPSNHCKEEDRPQIAAVLKSASFWGVQLLKSSATPVLGSVTHKKLFDTAMTDLHADALSAMRFLRDFGITRHHPAKPHAANPKEAKLPPVAQSYVDGSLILVADSSDVSTRTTGNGKCCKSGTCSPSIYIYKYCEVTSGGSCSAMSDECP